MLGLVASLQSPGELGPWPWRSGQAEISCHVVSEVPGSFFVLLIIFQTFFKIVYPLTLEVKYKLYRLNIDILNHCAGNKLTQLADYLLTTKKRNRRQWEYTYASWTFKWNQLVIRIFMDHWSGLNKSLNSSWSWQDRGAAADSVLGSRNVGVCVWLLQGVGIHWPLRQIPRAASWHPAPPPHRPGSLLHTRSHLNSAPQGKELVWSTRQ